jgi:hypothetical protein
MLPKGQRRCITCMEPFLTGSAPVTRSCRPCHENPKRLPKGMFTCAVCRKVQPYSTRVRTGTCPGDCTNTRQRNRRNTLRGRLNLCLQKARKRRPCTIDLPWLLSQWELQKGLCFYTGWCMALDGDAAYHPTLERLDSSRDYTPDNVVICCRQVNWAKNNYSLAQFKSMCEAVVREMGHGTS